MTAADSAAVIAPLRRRWRRVAAWTLGLVVLFTLAGFFGLPPLIKSQLEKAVREATGREATVGGVSFNPFTWRATLTQLTVQDRTAGPPLLVADEIVADLSSQSVWHRAPVFDALRVVAPRVHLARLPDGRYNIQDLIDAALADSAGPRPRYSLNNIEIVNGALDFDDQPKARTHQVTGVDVSIPFLSSLPVDVEVRVAPRLRAVVNGTAFALDGTTTPFAERRKASLDINLDALPLASYVAYAPVKLNVKLAGGTLSTRLAIAFTDGDATSRALVVTGDARLDGVAVQRTDGAPLLAAQRIGVSGVRIDVFGRNVQVAAVEIAAPAVDVRRAADGSLEWLRPLVAGAPVARGAESGPPWQAAVAALKVTAGIVRVADDTVAPAFRTTLSETTLTARNLSTRTGERGSLDLRAQTDIGATLAANAQLTLSSGDADGHVEIARLALARLYPYYADALDLEVGSGTLDLAGDFAYRPGREAQLTVTGGSGALNDLKLALPGERDPLWRMPQLAFRGVTFDLAKRAVDIAEIDSRGALARVRRDRDGTINYARLVKTTPATGRGDDATWTLLVRRLAIAGYGADFDDRVPATPVTLRAREIGGVIENFTNARGKRSTINLRARVGDAGRVAVNGATATNPAAGNVALDAQGLSLVSLQPYLDGLVNVTVTRGTLAAKGRLTFGVPDGAAATAPARVTYKGDVAIADFAALDKPTTSDLTRWKLLALTDVDVASTPVKVAIGKLRLDDFFARVIVYNDATLNLTRLLTPGAAPAPAESAAPATAAATATAPERAGPLPVAIGRIELAGGNVQFSDFFIRPNYSANLTDVAGTISAMSATETGDVAIAARIDRTAPVEIKGRLQPFARALSLDLTGSARDIELPPLSPYAAKYAGYGIQKGKLSFDVAYRIDQRRLDARNKLVLDQLTFGERIESPTATKLPVLLAVALLKDRNGVIDIELPVSGSLDDPEFSVGGLIVKVIVNLITKAVTAPFALLGALAGGSGVELSYVEFAPGTAVLLPAGEAKMTALAKALADRPGLKLEITGRSEPAADRAALADAAYDQLLRAQKVKALVAQGTPPESVAAVALTSAERVTYLPAAYRDAPIPERPRNVLGLLQDVPPAQMEALLRQHTAPADGALPALAGARAQAAKDVLTVKGVSGERLFILAPKPGAEPPKEGPPTRVDFALR